MSKKQQKILRKLLYWRPVRNTLHYSRQLVIPGFQGVPFFDVMFFFGKGLTKGVINQRSAAMSFHFFLSLFPLILFLFTLLPFMHLHNLTNQLLLMLQEFAPSSVLPFLDNTITDLMTHKHKGLMSIGFISSIYVASSGVNAMLVSFNQSQHTKKKKSFIKRRIMSISIVFLAAIAIIISLTLIMFSKKIFLFLIDKNIIDTLTQLYMLRFLKWTLLISIVYLGFASIYYFAPSNKEGYKFFSAGASLGTLLFILMTQGFNFYIIHFSRYNALYGSIGAMIIFLLWIYLSSYLLLIGYELNASIADAYIHGYSKNKRKKKSLIKNIKKLHYKKILFIVRKKAK
jgi:membrane protein